jgi:hypothetical protein
MFLNKYVLFVIVLLGVLSNLTTAGADYVPKSAYYHTDKNNRVLNIREAPFFAKGDGITDDTEAFVRAYDFVLNEIDKFGWRISTPASRASSFIIYIPNGEYLVSDTIIYSGEPRWYNVKKNKRQNGYSIFGKRGNSEALVWIRIQGEDKYKTIIRLKDNSDGFQKGEEKPVISFGKSDFNNLPADNRISDMTINTGKGNDGAIAILFAGANNSHMSDLDIISQDMKGSSAITLPIAPTMGWHSNISIIGFDYGIRLSAYHASHNSFENINLYAQNKSGVFLENGSATFRELTVRSFGPPAIIQNESRSLLVLHNSSATCHNECDIGIKSIAGQMFVSESSFYGYNHSIESQNSVLQDKYIKALVKNGRGELNDLSDDYKPMLVKKLPPIFESSNESDWVSPNEYGSRGDGVSFDTKAIQLALDSGKPIVYLPSAEYIIDSPLYIPCSVKRIAGLHSSIKTKKEFKSRAALYISAKCSDALTIEETNYNGSGTFVGHTSNRILSLRGLTTRSRLYENLNKDYRKELFLTNVNGWGKSKYSCINQDVWGRFVNTESPGSFDFYLDNCRLWLMGFKTEKLNTNFVLRRGAKAEILGGLVNQHDSSRAKGTKSKYPLLDCSDSDIAVSLVSTGPKLMSHGFEEFAKIKEGKEHSDVLWESMPQRGSDVGQIIVPLFQLKETGLNK